MCNCGRKRLIQVPPATNTATPQTTTPNTESLVASSRTYDTEPIQVFTDPATGTVSHSTN